MEEERPITRRCKLSRNTCANISDSSKTSPSSRAFVSSASNLASPAIVAAEKGSDAGQGTGWDKGVNYSRVLPREIPRDPPERMHTLVVFIFTFACPCLLLFPPLALLHFRVVHSPFFASRSSSIPSVIVVSRSPRRSFPSPCPSFESLPSYTSSIFLALAFTRISLDLSSIRIVSSPVATIIFQSASISVKRLFNLLATARHYSGSRSFHLLERYAAVADQSFLSSIAVHITV